MSSAARRDPEPGELLRELLARRASACDVRTGLLIALLVLVPPALVLLQLRGVLPWWGAVLLGTLVMNLSFTAWHEPAHGNFSASKAVNDAAGCVASLASVYPGYFARRREHLVHHRFQGDPGKDPVYARIQATFWSFPWKLLRANLTADAPATFLPVTRAQRAADALSNIAALSLVAASTFLGFFSALAFAWLVPRAIVFFLHAYTICFLPHAVDGGGYEVLRVREGRPLLRLLTVGQSLHGIHHRWPSIPWYRYRTLLLNMRTDLERAGVRIV